MKDWINRFLSSNDLLYRLGRTIVQGIIGVLIANLDGIFAALTIDPTIKPMLVALTMAILSPLMAVLGEKGEKTDDGE